MNKIFNVIWSKTKEQWIVVSERVKTNGGVPKSPLRSLAALAAMLLMDNPLFALDPGALPSGGQISAGSGTIGVNGSQMTVNQSSQQMIANWNSFNIGTNAAVQFNQPNSTSSALNRINDQNPTQIMGSLSANGRVFLVNPSGIIFGKTARVDAGAITASSLNMLDSDFLAGKYSFSNSDNAGMVINQGILNAMPGGVVALIGPKVSNEGTITTPAGSAVLAAGNQVSIDFEGDGLINLTVDQAAVDALAENKGLIKADGGLVVMTARAADALTQQVLSNSGVLEANTFVERDGRIILDGGESGITQSTGTITAKGVHSGETGGSVVMTGNKVGLFGAATVDVSGAAGGGRVNIGGGFQGKESSIQNACATVIDTDVNISADALLTGNGGNVVVWSNDHTAFGGSISARGGSASGDGGFVEVSSKGQLDFVGLVDAGAANGNAGSLLLDPKNIIVATGGPAVLSSNMLAFATNPGDDSTIAPSAITGATGLVTLQANNDITITSNITRISATGHLTLKAGRTITNNAIITIGSNTLTLIANAGTAAGVIDANREPGAASIINKGTITLVDPINSTGTVNMTLDAGTGQTYHETDSIFTGTVTAKTFNVSHNGSTAGGTITITGNLTSTGLTFGKPVTVTGNNLALNARTGTLTFVDTLNANANNLTLTGDDISIANAVSGTGTLVIQPYSAAKTIGLAGATEDFNLDGTELGYLRDGFSAITIGNSTAGRVTIGNTAMSYHDPLTIKTGNSIFFSTASSLTGNNNALTLWSRAGGSNDAADGVMGSVWMPVGSSVNSGGGAIVIGGGSDPSSGYALGDNDEGSSEGNARYRGVTLNGTLSASGGSLTISGKGNAATNARGVSIGGTVTTDGSGTITINGIAKGSSAGIALGDSALGGSSVGVVSTADGNIALTGIRNTTGYGIQLETTGSSIQTTGSGNALLTARGAISSAGTLIIGGTTTLTAETANQATRYDITASNTANDFTGAVTFIGNTISLSDTNTLTLGASTALGNLALVSNGAMTQSGAVSVAGTTDITAGSTNNIILDNTNNDFTGGIRIISGNDLSLHDTNGIVLGNSGGGITASGNLSVTGSTVTVNQAITAGSALTITTDAIALGGTLSGTGNLTIAPKSDNITMGVAGGAGTLNLDATEWGYLADGFATVTLGSSTAGALAVGATNLLNFQDSTILRSGAGVTVPVAITINGGYLSVDAGDIKFTGTIDGAADLQLNSSGTLTFDAAVGSSTPLSTLTATGGSLTLHDVTTTGNQTYRGAATITVGSGGISSTGGGTVDVRTSTGDIVLDGGVSVTGTGTILLAAAQNFINNKGTDALTTESGRWLVYSTDPRNDIRGNLVPQFKLYNATTSTVLPSATAGVKGFIYTLAPVITPTLTGTVEKQYDQTTVATLAASNYDATTGTIDGDAVTLNNPVTGNYDSKNAGTEKTVTVSGLAITSVADGTTAVYGYALEPTTLFAPIGIVTKAPLTVTGLVAQDKLYDGTTTADLNSAAATLNGLFTGDDVSLESATGLFDTRDAGSSKLVETTITLSGDDIGNYTYNTTVPTLANIAKARLTISAIGIDKSYDGTDHAVVTLTNNPLSVHENFTLAYASANFSGLNAASLPQAVSVTGITMVGVDASNYEFNTTAQTSAFINPKALTATVTVPDKIYDGTVTATPTVTITDGLVSSESVTASGTATFNSKNVPEANLVTVNSISLANGTGGLASNYSLVTGQTAAAKIIPASLQIIANDDAVHYSAIPYGGGNGFVYTGFINGENATVLNGTLAYGGSSQGATNCGTYTISLRGQTGSNYTITYVDGTMIISQVPLTPVVPEPIYPSLKNDLPANSAPLLDLGSFSGERNLQSFEPEMERFANGITVQMVTSPATPSSGLINVAIPPEMLRSESAFTISLPAEVIGSITAMLEPEQVCLLGGASLPNWIQYDCTTKTFSIHQAPEGVFPVTLQVSMGEKSWTMVISKKNS